MSRLTRVGLAPAFGGMSPTRPASTAVDPRGSPADQATLVSTIEVIKHEEKAGLAGHLVQVGGHGLQQPLARPTPPRAENLRRDIRSSSGESRGRPVQPRRHRGELAPPGNTPPTRTPKLSSSSEIRIIPPRFPTYALGSDVRTLRRLVAIGPIFISLGGPLGQCATRDPLNGNYAWVDRIVLNACFAHGPGCPNCAGKRPSANGGWLSLPSGMRTAPGRQRAWRPAARRTWTLGSGGPRSGYMPLREVVRNGFESADHVAPSGRFWRPSACLVIRPVESSADLHWPLRPRVRRLWTR